MSEYTFEQMMIGHDPEGEDLPEQCLRNAVRNFPGEPPLKQEDALIAQARAHVERGFQDRFGKPAEHFTDAMNEDRSRYVCMVW